MRASFDVMTRTKQIMFGSSRFFEGDHTGQDRRLEFEFNSLGEYEEV